MRQRSDSESLGFRNGEVKRAFDLSMNFACRQSIKCHCLRKCSRDQKLWSTDLAETWHRSWDNEIFKKPLWLTSLSFSFGVTGGVSFFAL